MNPLHPDADTYVCPRCGHTGDRVAFNTLTVVPEYWDYLIPIRVCPNCYHKFALKPMDDE